MYILHVDICTYVLWIYTLFVWWCETVCAKDNSHKARRDEMMTFSMGKENFLDCLKKKKKYIYYDKK